jgi:2-keto-4-pentenoate hydratase/2-oxohepta-3-ene-1,7-dioic acid hydratase in catechol pathway
MRVVRFRSTGDGEPLWGIVEGDRVMRAAGAPHVPGGLAVTTESVPLAGIELLPPATPTKIVCVGLNYLAHVTERDPTRKVPEEPVLFMKPPSALLATGRPIRIAHVEHRTDHEAELALVIGRRTRAVAESDALDSVWGYTAANDVSDRDL